ncbi:meiotic recombination protein REC8 homolog [Clupea harengus]|uniref:Meiotic recombination protein REC8 homolog n=1 Tax=Clupea harengus TaxID=7950 RepID=A0A8M1K6W2_CLUHA|nr:meiotic recombination protein REC8 homolog [Clupea harengus]
MDMQPLGSASPNALLSNPCCDLPPDILEIWKRGAAFTPVILARGQVAAEASEEEEEERELRRMEMEEEGRAEGERETDALEMAIEKELSSKETSLSHPEIPRGLEHSLSREESVVSGLSLELSDKDIPGTPPSLEPAELSRSPPQPSLGRLEDIPEEIPEPLQAQLGTPQDDWRVFFQPLQNQDEVTFHSLLPPTSSRTTVACSFWSLLENVFRKSLMVHQDEPYGEIFVSRGPLFNQVG